MTDFAPQFQADLLAACYANASTFERVKSFVAPEHITVPQLRWLYELGSYTIESAGTIPTPGLVAQEAGLVFADPHEFSTVIEVHADITTPRDGLASVVNRAAEFASQARFQALMLKAQRLREQGKVSEAMALMESANWKVEAMPSEVTSRALCGYDDLDKFHEGAKARRDLPGGGKLPTSIIGIDQALSGGLAISEMATLVGFTGRGKSSLLYNLTDSFIMHGFATILVLSEMRPDQVFARLLARRVRVTHNIIFAYAFTPEQEREYLRRLDMFKSSLAGKLYIDQVGTDNMTRDSVLRVLDAGEKLIGLPSAIGIDSPTHMKWPKDFRGEALEGRKSNASWLHGQFDNRKVVGVVTEQANRDGFEHTKLIHMADSMELARISEVVIAVNEDANGTRPNPEDHIDELLAPPTPLSGKTLSMIKARGGPLTEVPVSTDMATAFMSDRAADQFEKIG